MLFIKALIGVLAAGGVGTAVIVAVSSGTPAAERAVITHLVDGDTFDVSIGGRIERIRMLNIDTPETKDPNLDVQCLGPEAAAYLASLIPVGATVTLEYDEERTDRYGRTLAGVFTPDGTLVNAELARAGLATPVVVEGNDRFYPPVLEARDQAAASGRGLYSADVACTLPARVQAVTAAVAQAPTVATQPVTASSAELGTAAGGAAAAVVIAVALEGAFADDRIGHIWTAFPPGERHRLASQVTGLREEAQREQAALRSAAAAALERETAEAEAARVADQQRLAREAEARSREVHQPPQLPAPRPAPAPTPRTDPAPAPAADPYPGYTGPRCYLPGGKTYRPC